MPQPQASVGTTWGGPWPRGPVVRGQEELSLSTAAGEAVPVQTWPIGCWPGGTTTWTAHAIGTEVAPAEQYLLCKGSGVAPRSRSFQAAEVDDHLPT